MLRRMRGDFANGLFMLVVLPFYFEKAVNLTPKEHVEKVAAVCTLCTAVVLLSFLSFVTSNGIAAWLSFHATTAVIVASTLYQWPHAEQRLLLIHFFRQLFVATINGPLQFRSKMTMGALSAVTALLVSAASPLYEIYEILPFLVAGMVSFVLVNLAITMLVGTPNAPISSNLGTREKEKPLIQIVGFLAIALFVYHLMLEATHAMTRPGYAATGGFKIIRSVLFGTVGWEIAEYLRRRKSAKVTADHHISRMALSMSDTAFVLTDRHQRILWLNAAFVMLANKGSHSALLNASLDDILCPSKAYAKTLTRCFQTVGMCEDDIVVRGKILHITVMAFPPDQRPLHHYSQDSFAVTLQDVTEQRSLESLELQRARLEAVVSHASCNHSTAASCGICKLY